MASLNPENPQYRPVPILLVAIRLLLWILYMPLALFIAAGRWDWWMAWVYTIVLMLITLGSRALLLLFVPALAVERANALDRDDTKAWDKRIVPLMALAGPFLQALLAGLDERFSWSPVFPFWLEILGLAVMIAGYCFATWPMFVNPFFSSGVRIQKDRGHYVVSSGPYAFVRHPSYLGGIVGMIGASFALSSYWSLLTIIPYIAVTILRTKLEDDTLQAELTGYREYTEKTRYRLFPYIW